MKSGVRPPSQEELALINQHFSKRELSAEELYVFDIFAADDHTVTAYFSRLGSDMIEAFHRDAMKRHSDSKGPIVGYLFGHNDMMIPSGSIFKSELVMESMVQGENQSKVVQKFRPSVFMLKNLNVAGLNTDDYIRAYEAGHTEDVSVGFIAAMFTCDICGNDIRDFWNCRHVPGRTYVMNEAEVESGAAPAITKQCTYTVHPGYFKDHNLLELSGVYRGALWGARIESLSTKGLGDKQGSEEEKEVSVSTNIKDFKPTDILRFNYAFDGSIEKLGSIDKEHEESEAAKQILLKIKEREQEIQNLNTRIVLADKEIEALRIELESVKQGASNAQTTLETEIRQLKADLDLCGKNLAMSEQDKVELTQRLERLKQMEVENKSLKVTVEGYVNDLRARIEKLSIQINGTNVDVELLKKEIANLSIPDLRHKIDALEKQLAQMIPTGRKTKETGSAIVGDNSQSTHPSNKNPELYKIK